MFEYIGIGEIINIFILPFIGLAMCLIWYLKGNKGKEDIQ